MSTRQMTGPAELAGRREWIGLALLALPALLVAVDITALFLALPRLSADLHASSVEQLWITDSYGFLVAGFVITMGTLGDRVGRRRLLLIGAAAFAAVSVTAAYSVSPLMLIVARGALGIAGATLAPSTLALISSMFRDARQRGQAIAVWATCQFVGGAAGVSNVDGVLGSTLVLYLLVVRRRGFLAGLLLGTLPWVRHEVDRVRG